MLVVSRHFYDVNGVTLHQSPLTSGKKPRKIACQASQHKCATSG